MTDSPDPVQGNAAALKREMAEVTAIIDAAARETERGETADLSALGQRVETLCAALIALPAKEAREIGAGLPAITETLDRIAQILVQRGAATSGPSDSPVSRGRAARAYGASMSRGRR
jgi:hypothetical protein